MPRPMPATTCRYLVVVARRLPAATVCHRHLVVVPRPLPAAPFLVRRTYVIVVPRPMPWLLPGHRHLIVVPRPLPATPFLERRKYLTLDRGAEAVAHGAARCASHLLGRGAQAGA